MQRKSYLSFGGGVQSTAIAELIFDGTLPRPDAVVYADTGNEPDAVNAWVDLYETKFASAGIPFVRAKRGGKHASLGASIVAKALDGKGGGRHSVLGSRPRGKARNARAPRLHD
jgi:3'-phosphoadenosine 5'-phosphosulfate sulfotransferase (PAPS reductase)/FAD synthetase